MNKIYYTDLKFYKEDLKGFSQHSDTLYKYSLRDAGNTYTIEPYVCVNHIGDIVTNFEIEFEDELDKFILEEDFWNKYNPVTVYSFNEILD